MVQPAPRRVAFWLVFGVFVVAMLGNTLPTPLYVLYQADWGFSSGVLTLVFASYAAGVLMALLLVGRVSDDVGRLPVLHAALVLSGLSTVVFLLASGIGWLFVGRVLSGLSAGLVTGTATAALSELADADGIRQASIVSTVAATGGLGLGPVLAGTLAEYAPHPTRLVFLVYLALLVLALGGLLAVPETRPARGRVRVRFLGFDIPSDARWMFVGACVAGFASFALMGLFTALAPSFLGQLLHVHNRALGGLLVALLFAGSTCTQAALGRRDPERTMRAGLGVFLVALVLAATALHLKSMSLFVLTALAGGVAAGAAFVGSLATANAIAPPDRRGQVVSTYFTCSYVGLTVPVIGVGYAAEHLGLVDAVSWFALALGVLVTAVLLRRTRAPLTT